MKLFIWSKYYIQGEEWEVYALASSIEEAQKVILDKYKNVAENMEIKNYLNNQKPVVIEGQTAFFIKRSAYFIP